MLLSDFDDFSIMELKKVVTEIDETRYNQVILDVDEAKQGQRFTLPKQENPDVTQFEGKEFFVSDIDRGAGSPDTVMYKIRTAPPRNN